MRAVQAVVGRARSWPGAAAAAGMVAVRALVERTGTFPGAAAAAAAAGMIGASGGSTRVDKRAG
eukprot:74308-Pelagomonas_calceolata.AAC.4